MARKHPVPNYTVSFIKPARRSAAPSEPIPITFLDLFVVSVYVPTYFAYCLPDDSFQEYTKFATRIKDSLQEVLVTFAPYAGRWVTTEEKVHQLVDNSDGVPLIETYLDKDIDEVVHAFGGDPVAPDLNAISYEAAGLKFEKMQQEVLAGGLPPLVVQITRFRKGGVALGVSFNHGHCDAKAYFQFMSSWAEVARTGKTTIQPDFDRSNAPTFEASVKEAFGDNVPTDGFLGRLFRLESGMVQDDDDYVARVYEVKASAIAALKKEAKARPGGQWVSTNDCVTAHLSKSLALLPASLKDGKETKVSFAFEGREKFYNIPIPTTVGNVITGVVPRMPANAEVAKTPISSLAQMVRESVLQVPLDKQTLFTVDSLMGVLCGFDSAHEINGWVSTSWSAYHVYDIDFGVGGRPYFCVPYNTLHGRKGLGTNFVLPPIPGHSSSAATMYFHCTPEVLKALESLEEFWSFYTETPGLRQS